MYNTHPIFGLWFREKNKQKERGSPVNKQTKQYEMGLIIFKIMVFTTDDYRHFLKRNTMKVYKAPVTVTKVKANLPS